MHNIKILTFALILSIFINACGSGSSKTEDTNNSNENSNSFSSEANPSQNTLIVKSCPDDVQSIKNEILSGDILQAEEENTKVKIIHNEDNTRFVCVVSGKASLIRE